MSQNFIPSTLTRAIFAAFLFLAAALSSHAQQSGDFTYEASATAVTITGYTGTGGAVTIPSSIGGLPVTSMRGRVQQMWFDSFIYYSAFAYSSGLTSVTIPNSVTSIGDYAFYGCSGLTSVAIPNSVTSIGQKAFFNCTGLTSVTIPNSVTSIGASAFYGCSGLTSVTICSGVTSIGSNAFQGCTGLTSVTIPNLMTLGVLFPNSSNLISVTLAEGVTAIRDSMFSGTGLTSVTIPNSVTYIGSNAFSGCTGLTSVKIPNSVTSIGRQAFQYCTGLTSVTIGNGVTLLDYAVFDSCTVLTSVTIGNGVTRIGQQPFNNCLKLAGIYFQGNAPYFDYGVLLDTDTNTLVYFVLGTYGWSSSFGGKSTVALGPPIINEQPSNVIANLGESVEFSVLASSSIPLPLSYQWKRNGITIQSATTATLSLNGVQGTNAGSYFVVVTNQYGSVRSSNASLTLSQGNLYTQAQFDSAFKTGYDLGVSSGGGDADVLANPNSYGLYSLTQVQALNVGTPLLVKNPTTGKFKLTVGVEKSTNLENFTPMPIPVSAVINAQGKMEFEFTSTDNAAFFRVGSK